MPARVHRSNLIEVAKNMPPLYHTIPRQEFDISNSEVVNWLLKQPDTLKYVWNNIKNSGSVIYDSDTGKWQGVDYTGEITE